MAGPTPLEIAHSYFSSWNAHDVDAIASLFGDAGTFWDNQMPRPLPMRDLKQGFEGLIASTKDLGFDVGESFQTTDGRVAVEWVMKGTKPDGTEFAIPGIDVFEIEDATIKAARAYMNPVSLT